MASGRWSWKRISRPLLRNAIIWKRSSRVWARKLVSSKMVGSGQKRDGGAGAPAGGLAGDVELGLELAALLEVHVVAVAVAVDLDLDARGERVHDRDADAVEAAGDLVAAAAELAAGVQHGEHDLGRGQALHLRVGVLVGGDAAAVVDDLAATVGQQGDRRCGWRGRPWPRRRSCRRPRRRGGAGRRGRWSRCTCRVACGRPRGLPGPGCPLRRTLLWSGPRRGVPLSMDG